MALAGHPPVKPRVYNGWRMPGLRHHHFGKWGEGRVRSTLTAVVAALLLLALGGGAALAHQTKAVGPEGEYLVIVGFEKEPIFTDERNGLDLIIRDRKSTRLNYSHVII